MRITSFSTLVCVFFALGAAHAQEPVPQPASQKPAFDFTHCWGGCNANTHTDKRAGCPQEIASYARPAESPAFGGYYVGGGNAFPGRERTAAEGTWGWDYEGRFLLPRVALSWTHGRRYQGGSGAYRADGRVVVPDLPGAVTAAVHPRAEEHK